MKLKYSVIALFTIILFGSLKAQWTNKTLTLNSVQRTYRVYVPAMYNSNAPASMVIALHGLGDNMTNFSNIGMNLVADTANIIVVVPQALTDALVGNAWNSKAGFFNIYPNPTVDDIGFINALVDTTAANYAINLSKVYLCGFSMGGFMTNRMACESNGKFAAFGSVAGTFGAGLGACNPGKSISIVHFHGTADGTVGYYTNNYGVNADSLVNFWVNNNACTVPGTQTSLPDIQNDGFTIDHYNYQGNKNVEFFKVNGAGHIWLTPANDISYTIELWKFFRKHQLLTGIKKQNLSYDLLIYPNPSSGKIKLELGDLISNNAKIEVYDLKGALMYSKMHLTDNLELDLKEKGIGKGAYMIRFKSENMDARKLLIID